jgi:hypothetical protein
MFSGGPIELAARSALSPREHLLIERLLFQFWPDAPILDFRMRGGQDL